MTSMEKRELIRQARVEGMSVSEMSRVYRVPKRTLYDLLAHERETGTMAPNSGKSGRKPALDAEQMKNLRQLILDNPDITLEEIKEEMQLDICISAIHHIIKGKLGFTYKKKTVHASERESPKVKEQREEWKQTQNNIPASKYVFIDESGVNTNMSRRYARSLQGCRAHDAIPLNRGKTTTIVSSVRLDGTTVSVLIDGAMNGEKFKDYVQNNLVPHLHKDDVVVMDNLTCHKVAGICEAIEGAQAHVAYLPPYSHDLNPIEEMWSKIKAYLRKVKARSHDRLLLDISAAF